MDLRRRTIQFSQNNTLLLILIICCFNNVFSQEYFKFNKLEKQFTGGIIQEDNYGFMWVSNREGIYKYDGYEFHHYPFTVIFGDEFTKDKDFIVKKDSHNNFWIASFKGELSRIHESGEINSFKDSLSNSGHQVTVSAITSLENSVYFGSSGGDIYHYDYNDLKIEKIGSIPKKSDESVKIRSMVSADENSIWLNTDDGIIYKYFIKEGKFEQLIGLNAPVNPYTKITVDKKGHLWIATEFQGLLRYDGNEFKQFDILDSTKSAYAMFLSLFCDQFGNIWAGTDGDGLLRIDHQTYESTFFKHEELNKFSISDNSIVRINEDSHGNIWMTDKKGTINILQSNSYNISYYSGHEKNKPISILSVLKSRDGAIWLGTDGYGLTKIESNSKIRFSPENSDIHNFEGKFIQCLREDHNGNLWIGTYQNGLWFYNTSTSRFSKVKIESKDLMSSVDIRYIYQDSKNRIWVTAGSGIHVVSTDQQILANFYQNNHGLFGRYSHAISEDFNKTLWVGLNQGGLFRFVENDTHFEHSYFRMEKYHDPSTDMVSNYNIQTITPDHENNLWLLVTEGKLIKFNMLSKEYEVFTTDTPLDDIRITSIIFENNEILWLSSTAGIHRYNLTTKKLNSYYEKDGLQGNTFNRRSAFRDAFGYLYFGGQNGASIFHPSEISTNESDAKLFINSIEILNTPISTILPDQIKLRPEEVKNLELTANQSSFSFSFAAIENLINPNYHYAYRLKGFNDEWIKSKENRIATYTNIPHGNYEFEVKAGTTSGVFDIEPISIDIDIKAPWWLSQWAIIFYILSSLIIGYSVYIWLKLKRKMAKEEWLFNQEKDLYALKMNFFAKMSHEIQSPLTLILGPIDDMLERANSKGNQLLNQRLKIIKNNAYRLSKIANELMTIRNKELGQLKLYASKNNLTEHLKTISLSFQEQARFKNVDFIREFPENDIFVWYDKDKMEHVFYNLLSNAFKFTPREGTIKLKLSINTNNEFVDIAIKDSGPGISKNEFKNIFKLFYQSEHGKKAKGTGIGLALAKEMITLHKGEIDVTSSKDAGTTFTVKLSSSEYLFTEDEKLETPESELKVITDTINHYDASSTISKSFGRFSTKKYKILIVEDNIDMQIFLNDILSPNYEISIAENGEEGLKLAFQNTPDLILSDVSMSKMDGIQMTKKLQHNSKTAHVPVILLTAKNTTNTKIKGLKSGAIEYIRKPFNVQELLIKIFNILNTKERILSKFKADIANSPKEIAEKNKNDLFLERLVQVLNNQLDNPDFKLESLSQYLNMSYSVIYRKCYDITGQTLVEFVRCMRLKKAAYLIVKQGYNVSEAAYIVGYKDSKYFTKCFKEVFGITPVMMKKESSNNDTENVLGKYKIYFDE